MGNLPSLFVVFGLVFGRGIQDQITQKLHESSRALEKFEHLLNGELECSRNLKAEIAIFTSEAEACNDMSEDEQSFYTVKWTNCHLEETGLSEQVSQCSSIDDVHMCLKKFGQIPTAYNTYTLFRVHIKEMCFHAQRLGIEQRTQTAVHSLFSATRDTANNLETLTNDAMDHSKILRTGFQDLQQQHAKISDKFTGLSTQTLGKFEELRVSSDELEKKQQAIMKLLHSKSDELLGQMTESMEAQDYLKHAQTDVLNRIISTHSQIDELRATQDNVLKRVTAAMTELQHLAQAHDEFVTKSLSALSDIETQQERVSQNVKSANQAVVDLQDQQNKGFQQSKKEFNILSEQQGELQQNFVSAKNKLDSLRQAQEASFKEAHDTMKKIQQPLDEMGQTTRVTLEEQRQLSSSLQQAHADAKSSFDQLQDKADGIQNVQDSIRNIAENTKNELVDVKQAVGEGFLEAKSSLGDIQEHANQLLKTQDEHNSQLNTGFQEMKKQQDNLREGVTKAQDSLAKLQESQQESFENASKYLTSIEEKAKIANEKVNGALKEMSSTLDKLLNLDYSMMGHVFTLSSSFFYCSVMVMIYLVTSLRKLASVRLLLFGLYGVGYGVEWYISGIVPELYMNYCSYFRQVWVSMSILLCIRALFTYQNLTKKNFDIAVRNKELSEENKDLLNQLVKMVETGSPQKSNLPSNVYSSPQEAAEGPSPLRSRVYYTVKREGARTQIEGLRRESGKEDEEPQIEGEGEEEVEGNGTLLHGLSIPQRNCSPEAKPIDTTKPLERYTVAQLKGMCEQRGLTTPKKPLKKQLVELLKKQQ